MGATSSVTLKVLAERMYALIDSLLGVLIAWARVDLAIRSELTWTRLLNEWYSLCGCRSRSGAWSLRSLVHCHRLSVILCGS